MTGLIRKSVDKYAIFFIEHPLWDKTLKLVKEINLVQVIGLKILKLSQIYINKQTPEPITNIEIENVPSLYPC